MHSALARILSSSFRADREHFRPLPAHPAPPRPMPGPGVRWHGLLAIGQRGCQDVAEDARQGVDEPWRLFDRQPEGGAAGPVLPQAEHDDALVGMPGHLHPAAVIARVHEGTVVVT